MSSHKVDCQYEIRRWFYPDSIKIVREHSFEDALSLTYKYYMNFMALMGDKTVWRRTIKDSCFSHSDRKNFPSFEDISLRLEKFNNGLELFSYEDKKKVYGAFCEYYYEIFNKRCKKSEKSNVLLYLRNDFTHIARLWGVKDSEKLNLFIENTLRPILEIISPCEEIECVFFRK